MVQISLTDFNHLMIYQEASQELSCSCHLVDTHILRSFVDICQQETFPGVREASQVRSTQTSTFPSEAGATPAAVSDATRRLPETLASLLVRL